MNYLTILLTILLPESTILINVVSIPKLYIYIWEDFDICLSTVSFHPYLTVKYHTPHETILMCYLVSSVMFSNVLCVRMSTGCVCVCLCIHRNYIVCVHLYVYNSSQLEKIKTYLRQVHTGVRCTYSIEANRLPTPTQRLNALTRMCFSKLSRAVYTCRHVTGGRDP